MLLSESKICTRFETHVTNEGAPVARCGENGFGNKPSPADETLPEKKRLPRLPLKDGKLPLVERQYYIADNRHRQPKSRFSRFYAVWGDMRLSRTRPDNVA